MEKGVGGWHDDVSGRPGPIDQRKRPILFSYFLFHPIILGEFMALFSPFCLLFFHIIWEFFLLFIAKAHRLVSAFFCMPFLHFCFFVFMFLYLSLYSKTLISWPLKEPYERPLERRINEMRSHGLEEANMLIETRALQKKTILLCCFAWRLYYDD